VAVSGGDGFLKPEPTRVDHARATLRAHRQRTRRLAAVSGGLWVAFGVLLIAGVECVSWGLGLQALVLVGLGVILSALWCLVTAVLVARGGRWT
jgi:hypothetical protein